VLSDLKLVLLYVAGCGARRSIQQPTSRRRHSLRNGVFQGRVAQIVSWPDEVGIFRFAVDGESKPAAVRENAPGPHL
jgi:hypothetical protein